MTGTLPPGSALPSSARCASRVRHDRWEPRPANYPENHTKGARLVIPAADWRGFPAWRALARRVAGLFTGTTDQIMAWASCKWGFAGDLTRAEALVESHWHQWWVGDGGASVGLMQVKSDGADTPHHYTWPHSRDSTSYNVDYALAWRRACYEGYFAQGGWLPSSSRGDLWGCVGLWYSGVWHRGDAAYVAAVRRALRNRRWLKWEADQRRSRGHCAAATFSELPTPSAALAWLARAE
jgi:autotransporter family porin